MTTDPNQLDRDVAPGDVIQLDPGKSPWGPMLAIVDEVKPWGVVCYWSHATERGKAPATFPYRAERGAFVRIGPAEWRRATEQELEHLRELARNPTPIDAETRAQLEAGTFGEQPGHVRALVEGLLGNETPASRAAVERYFAGADGTPDPLTIEVAATALERVAAELPGETRIVGHAERLRAVADWLRIRRETEAQRVDVAIPAGVRVDSVHIDGKAYRSAETGPVPSTREAAALAFCFRVALEHDHGGAKRLRRLLYAWHNAQELGGFDFSDLWSLDQEYRAHALTLINMIARSPQGWYAEHYGYAADMAAIVDTYGPAVVR